MTDWTPTSWTSRPIAQDIAYDDPKAVATAVARLAELPPLVTSWEVEELKHQIADAQEGRRFVLQGGDCAETAADCRPTVIANKLKILLQMSLVLVLGGRKPVVRIGRLAGQYAKPRSSPTETRNGVTLPSYFGDLVNRPEFTPEARRPDPNLLIDAYQHSALTLNFVRALITGGFADLHHPEYWDLSFFSRAGLPSRVREDFERLTRRLDDAIRFMEALGEGSVAELSAVKFFTSHEGLSLHYEAAQTRTVPRNPGFYDLSTHMPWIGERTRQLDGAHVELFSGIRNPVGVKLGPKVTEDELLALIRKLNPKNEPGRLVLITRMGADKVRQQLPRLVEPVLREKLRVLWMCDPMHGNGVTLATGQKTRSFDAILDELKGAFEVHDALGSILGGVHFELTGDDVTECIGAGISEQDLSRAYETACDPRLNYAQSLELAFALAAHFQNARARK